MLDLIEGSEGSAALDATFLPTGGLFKQAVSDAAKTQTARILVMMENLRKLFLLCLDELAQLKL